MARKYNNRKVTVDGIEFDSAKEAGRYRELKLLLGVGEIRNLELQKRFQLLPAQYESYERFGKRGQRLKDGRRCVEGSVVYVADFAYQRRKTGAPARAQRSGSCGERTTSEVSELSPQGGSEGYEAWEDVVEDTKGYRKGTAYDVFVIKRKLMRRIYGIKIQEV